MPNQDGLRFLFDIQDKITAKLAKIEAKAVSSGAKIDKAFTRSSKAMQASASKSLASQKRIALEVEKTHDKANRLRASEATKAEKASQRIATATAKSERRRIITVEKTHDKANKLRASEATKATKAAARTSAAQIKAEQKRIVAVEKSHTKAVSLIKRESDEFKRSMTRMASAATVAFAAVAGKAIQMAGGYDLAMRSVQAKTGATGALMDRLSEQSREMGRTTVHSATEAARGQAFLAQAGFDVHEVLEALPATLALATSGELDLAAAADIASNVLSGFRLETDQAARVADVLAKAADSSNTNVAQLGAALAKAAPSAAAAGWSLEETAAAIGKLSDAGIQGEEAGTALKTMMAKLAIDGGPAEKLMAKMGITVKDTTGQMLPLNDILTALAPHANDVGLQFELLGTRGGNAGLVLGAVAQDAAVLTEELIDSAGWAQKNADIMSGGLWGALKEIQSIIESAYISFGERFTPAIKTLAALFKTLPAPIQEVVVVVGSLAGAMGGLMLMMPGVFGAIVQLPGKLIALTTKIGATTLSLTAMSGAIKGVWIAITGPVGLTVAVVAAAAAFVFFWRESEKAENKLPRLAKEIDALTRRIEEQGDATPGQTRRLTMLTEAYEAITPPAEAATVSIGDLARAAETAAAALAAEADAAVAAADAVVAAAEAAADEVLAIEADKRRAIVEHIQKRREAERAADDARVQEAADSAQAIVDIEAAKRRAIVLHIQKRREAARDADIEAAAAADKVEQSSAKLNVTLAALAGQMGGAAGQSLNLVASMIQTNDQLKEGEEGFSRVQIGAAVAGAAFHALGDAIGGTAGEILSAAGDIAAAFATGGPVAAAIVGVGALIKGLKSLFGPSEAELEARRMFDGFHKGVVDTLGGTQAYIDEVQVAIAAGWDSTNAETRAGFILWGTEAGLTYDQAFVKYAQYENAVSAGNTTLMEQLEAEFAEYRQTAEETNEAAAKAAEDAAAKTAEFWERATNAAISGYEKAKAAGVKAYDEVMEVHGDYVRAVHAGDDELAQEIIDNHGEWVTSHDATLENALANQADANSEILADEGEKYVRIARFEAALEAIRSGNALGASAAADQAARETAEAWDISLKAVTEADAIASQAMQTSSEAAADKAILEAERMSQGVLDELQRIPTKRTVQIEYHGTRTGSHGGVEPRTYDVDYYGLEGRQHGGPVRAGRSYLVGEDGPERFVPSRSGRIEPNGSSGGGGVDAKALAKAVADALHGTRVDVDGRQLGRLTIRHQPLAVAELGGRR